MNVYKARPAYQQNDYLGRNCRSKRSETRTKRLTQMITAPKGGKRYMGMVW